MMELSDNRRNAILQTCLVRLDEGKKGPPKSYSPEEKDYYLGLEESILSDREKGIDGNYSISCSNDDW